MIIIKRMAMLKMMITMMVMHGLVISKTDDYAKKATKPRPEPRNLVKSPSLISAGSIMMFLTFEYV